MHGCSPMGGHAWLLPMGGHAWLLPGGVCMVAPRGACMVAPGRHAWLLGGHAWLLLGGMRGCSGGACVGYDDTQRYSQ